MFGHAFGESEGDTHIKWRCHERARGQGGTEEEEEEGLNPKEGNDSFMEMSGGERREGGTTTLATGEEERERGRGTKLLPCCDDEPNLASRRVGGTAEEGVKWRCRSRTRLEGYYTYRFGHLFVPMLPDQDSRY